VALIFCCTSLIVVRLASFLRIISTMGRSSKTNRDNIIHYQLSFSIMIVDYSLFIMDLMLHIDCRTSRPKPTMVKAIRQDVFLCPSLQNNDPIDNFLVNLAIVKT
jgi:hypothetical protein